MREFYKGGSQWEVLLATHLGKGEIGDLLTGRVDEVSRRRALQHLLDGCSLCHENLRVLAELLVGEEPWRAAEPIAEDQYEEPLARVGVFARSFRKRWRKEMEKLDRALTLLEQSPGGLGDASFPWRQAQALHGWPLCEALLQKSHEARFSDPKRMLNLAESAVGVARNIKVERYPWPGFVGDLRARAFAELGNALRVNDRLFEAEAAMDRARNFLDEGTGDLNLRARVLDLFASLRTSQRRLENAIVLLDQAHGFYIDAGDSHLAGRALILEGANTLHQGYPQKAVALIKEGLQSIDPTRDPPLEARFQVNLLDALAAAGEYHQASLQLLQGGLRQRLADEPLNLLKLRWVEGKVHAGLGRREKAERALSDVRQEFLRQGQAYDAALVGLDLAALWTGQGRVAQVRRLAKEVYATLKGLGVQREAARAVYFMREV
ncbi:MAG TPA: hypothetical protein VGG20_02050 [Thermoanaerobaculia bacterium]|jgi:tetratricopeptide (TPR) repeat protein